MERISVLGEQQEPIMGYMTCLPFALRPSHLCWAKGGFGTHLEWVWNLALLAMVCVSRVSAHSRLSPLIDSVGEATLHCVRDQREALAGSPAEPQVLQASAQQRCGTWVHLLLLTPLPALGSPAVPHRH